MKHLVHEVRHSQFGKRIEHHRGRMVIVALIVIQLLIWGLFHFRQLLPVTPNTTRTNGDYATLSTRNDSRGLIGDFKRGAIVQATKKIPQTGNDLPDRAVPIKKVFFLLEKNDYKSAEQLLSTLTHPYEAVRSLYLQLRAYMRCAQKKQLECEVLATDANALDPLAPGPLQMLGIAQSMNRDRINAQSSFQRAEALGAVCDDPVCLYYRGIMAFYRAQYTGAIADLKSITEDALRGNDAALFLGRTYYNQRMRDEANQRFDTIIARKEGIDRTASMRKARILREQEQGGAAMEQYMQIYSGEQYGFEMLMDMVVLAYEQNNQAGIDEFLTKAKQIIGTSIYSHLLMVRTLRSIELFDLADQYLLAGLSLTETIETPEQKLLSVNDFATERLHIIVARRYASLVVGNPTQTLYQQIQIYATDSNLPLFLQLLAQLIKKQAPTTILPGIPPTTGEYALIEGRYYLLADNTRETLKIIVNSGSGQQGIDDERLLRTKRAVAKRLQQPELIEGFELTLTTLNKLPEGFASMTEKQKRQYALGRFNPWMKRMQPYLMPLIVGLTEE